MEELYEEGNLTKRLDLKGRLRGKANCQDRKTLRHCGYHSVYEMRHLSSSSKRNKLVHLRYFE